MKKFSLFLISILCLAACSSEETNLSINGKVEGLKKGTLYLQKIEDTTLVSIDSVKVEGDPVFNFETYIESPQVYYLYLDKVDGSEYNDRITFFAEPDEMTINTSLKNFEADAVIEGSKNQEKLADYRKMMKRFNDRNLELIQANLQAQQEENEEAMQAANEEYEGLIKRRYLYTVNFAINNKDMEVAPYLAISEVYDANIKYLDTIYKSLSPEIKDSKYGQSLSEFLKERRKMEKLNEVSSESSEENL
ncbi:DUF4369 domain-containing protein [Salinimicrobium sp. GXAS 041]|uniref:DUF4369 domain-containing protein n=1 Tax=Salinimicrobium sp. GXAS 041 TaxID=3400806 RepID=UPI003C764767